MEWGTIPHAAKIWGNACVGPKTAYQAARDGKLRVARIGAGRNMVTCREWFDEWLVSLADPGPAAVAAERVGRDG
jgi:hypothetical protein